jgi:hypothetical protein
VIIEELVAPSSILLFLNDEFKTLGEKLVWITDKKYE